MGGTEGKKDKGVVYVVGFGSGGPGGATLDALEVMDKATVLVGYTIYLELLEARYPDKRMVASSMREERDRCSCAVKEALRGEVPALLCGGDAGIYGMAGMLLEMAAGTGVRVVVVPGVTAACSCAALLGAPLDHDFAAISLAGLFTPWETTEKRLLMAAEGDLVVSLYNVGKPDVLRRACDALLRVLPPERPCGIVANAGREDEWTRVLTLRELRDEQVNSFTTVFIGCSITYCLEGDLVTPRGSQR